MCAHLSVVCKCKHFMTFWHKKNLYSKSLNCIKELHGFGDYFSAQAAIVVCVLAVCANDKNNDGNANDGKMPKKKKNKWKLL